jgi:methylase of polypeptide subunit release factors
LNSIDKPDCEFDLAGEGDLRRLRDALVAGGYDSEALAEVFAVGSALTAFLKATSGAAPAHTLIRLFKLAQMVPVAAARDALAPVALDELIDRGLLRQVDGHVTASAAISPAGDGLYLAHDFDPFFTGGPAAPNYVLENGPSSDTLASLAVRRGGEQMLDLCVGGGIQSLLSAGHAAHIVGTDVNQRALNFAEFSARLNGVTNLELRRGDLFDPVADERYDLIVANPPFVISPRSIYQYRDSGLPGDSIGERVIRELPSHLKENGFASVIFNWHHRDDQDWSERPLSWVANSGCDAWLTAFDSEQPLKYAARWIKHGEAQSGADRAALLDEWLEYHRRLGIGMITFGAIIMRRRSTGPNWVRTDRVNSSGNRRSFSEQILRIFAAQDFLAENVSDQRLLAHAFALVPDHEMRQIAKSTGDGWTVESASLRHTRGFEFIGRVDAEVMTLLGGCNGQRTLNQLFAGMAERLKVDFDRFAPGGLKVIRTLIASGFMTVPADPRFESPPGRNEAGRPQ